MFNYSFPNLFFFASNFKIKYYCFYAKNVCKPNRFFFLLQLSWFSSRKRYKLQYFKSHLSLFRRLWLLNSRLPPGPSPVFYCCYYFRPPVRVFGLGRSWKFHVLGTPKTSSVAEKCADGKQSLFIFHVLESVERRSLRDARSSLNEPKKIIINAKRRDCFCLKRDRGIPPQAFLFL